MLPGDRRLIKGFLAISMFLDLSLRLTETRIFAFLVFSTLEYSPASSPRIFWLDPLSGKPYFESFAALLRPPLPY